LRVGTGLQRVGGEESTGVTSRLHERRGRGLPGQRGAAKKFGGSLESTLGKIQPLKKKGGGNKGGERGCKTIVNRKWGEVGRIEKRKGARGGLKGGKGVLH